MPQLSLVSQFGNPTLTSLRVVGNTIMGNTLNVIGSVTVSGSLTAQSLIVNSTNVITGSTKFGSVSTNTHQFTGSVLVTGSMNVVGSVTATSFAGSGASLTSIPNSATTATNANTANAIVTRDASGNFSAGTITATLSGNISGNAATVTTNANLTGNVTSVGNVTTIAAGVVTNAMLAGSIANTKLTNSTISGIALGSNLATLTIGTGLSGTSYNGSGAVTIANTGVTSIVAGTGITINQGTGAVTVTNNISNTNQLTNGAGFITSAGTSADSNLLNGISAVNLYNNMGGTHPTRTSFDASTPSYGFGYRYVQGSTNGPGTGGSQYYSWYIGLGSDYAATGAGSYGAMFAVDRNVTGPYLSVRYNENNSFGSWRRINAGFADSAGSVAWTNVSGRPTALSQFSNDLGNYGGWITSAGTAAAISQTVTGTNSAELVRGNMADNDQFRILIGGGASNAGYVEIATADDGTEPIYVRQYTGVFSSVTRTATLLDGSGNTSFPGNISGAYILGSYFNASAGNSENPSIGQIWTQNTTDNYLRKSTPAHLISQLGLITTGNYSSYALPLSGGTISGNVTINGSSNTVLTLSAAEPHLRIAATGASNVAGIVIVPTSGYDAFVGNFNNGATNIMASSVKIGQFRKDGNSTDLQMGTGASDSKGSVSFFASNFGNGYEGRISGVDDGNTHFFHRNNNSTFNDVGYFNQSGFYIDVLGGASDIRLKDIIETNPIITIDGIDVIKYTFKSNPSLTRYGYSAQQVQSILPDLITINSPISGSVDEGTLMLNYNDLHVLKIAALERKVAQLQVDIAALKS
jgi:hypothetical protein